MNVQLLPAALEEIGVLRATGYRGAGFLLGSAIGRFVLVERLLSLDFDRRTASAAYGVVFKKYGELLQGIFFCRKSPIILEWSIGDLVLAIGPKEIQAFTCEFDAALRKARLAPLLEDAEEKWRT